MPDELIPYVLTVVAVVSVFGTLIVASHPEWFRMRGQDTPLIESLLGEEDYDDNHAPVPMQLSVWAEDINRYAPVAHPINRSDFQLIGDSEDGERFLNDLDQLDAAFDMDKDQLAQVVEPSTEEEDEPIVARYEPIIETRPAPLAMIPLWEAPRTSMPKRRKDYKFCIGLKGGVQLWFGLDHILVVKKSRGGKSNLVVIVIGQCHQQGIEVWYGDVSFKPVSEDGLNVNPIIQRCARVELDPTGLGQLAMLEDALDLIDRRAAQAQAEEIAYFPPVLVVFEEAKAWQDALALIEATDEKFKKVATRSGRMLSKAISTGAGVNVNFMILSQDAQNGTLGMTKGSVGNFGVRIYHPGLDTYSLNNLLPKGVKADQLPKPNQEQLESPTSRPWWITYEELSGQEKFDVLDVPRMQPSDVQRYISGVRIPERQGTAPAPRQQPGSASELWGQQEAPDAPAPLLHFPQQGGPIITKAASGQVVAPQVKWSADHVKASAWFIEQDEAGEKISYRALAMHLWGKSGGRHNQRAKAILYEVATALKISLDGMEQVERDEESSDPES